MTAFRNPLAAWVGRDANPNGAKEFAGRLWRETGLIVFVPNAMPPHQRRQAEALAEAEYGKRKPGR